MTTKFLRNVDTGVIFGYNDIIAQQPWMVPYEEEEGEAISEAIQPAVEDIPVKTEIKITAEISAERSAEVLRWEFRKNDGPVLRDVVKLANMLKVNMDSLENFNPGPSDLWERCGNNYNPISIKAAVSEFKVRAKNGE